MSPLDCKLILDALAKQFDDFDARWERRFSETRIALETAQVLSVPTQAAVGGSAIVADSWGGLFGGDDNSIAEDTHTPVADNWGGLFDGDDVLSDADQTRNNGDANENNLTYSVHDTLLHTDQGRAMGPIIVDHLTVVDPATLQHLASPTPDDITGAFGAPASESFGPTSEKCVSIVLDAACASPTAHIPPQDMPSKVLVTASSKPATISIHAQMVFVEMPNCTQTLTASKPAPVFTSRVAAMAPTSMSSSVLTSAHELLGGLLSRYITILFPTPMMDVLLLDCAATVHEGQRNQNMAELEVVVRAEPARTQPWMPSLAGRATTLLCAVRGHHEEKGYKSVEYDIWTGFSIRKQDGGSANYGNNCTSHLESFHSDAESNVSLDLNVARRALTMCIIIAGQSPSLVDGVGFQSFVSALNRLVPVSRPTFDQDLMTLYGREKDALHSTISETFDAGWKLQRRIVGFKFMEIIDDDNFIVVVLPYLASKGPWPPPDELRLTSCDVELRPTPWPTFIMAEWFSVNSYCGRLWKPPWPIQICQQINIFHEFTLQWCFVFDCGKCLQLGGLHLLLSLSMVGCALIHKLVQRKCGGNCWCFLLEVAGQQSQVVGGKTRDHWRAEQDLLQQFLSSGTTVGSSGNLLALVALMVMDDKPTVRWVHSTDLISDQTYKLLNVFCDYKSLVHSFPQCDKILDIANTEALILSSTQQ